jgi:plasmid stabilization system protein ParE
MRVDWSNPARDDLDDLVRYISRDSAFYARLFAERIVLSTRALGNFPESGRIIPEAEDKTLREIIVQGYRVMYRLEPTRVLSSQSCMAGAMLRECLPNRGTKAEVLSMSLLARKSIRAWHL